jgi:hypothetical protein
MLLIGMVAVNQGNTKKCLQRFDCRIGEQFHSGFFYQQQADASSDKGWRGLPTESVDNPVRYLIISLSKPCGSRGTKNQRKNIAKLKHIKIKWLNFMMSVAKI